MELVGGTTKPVRDAFGVTATTSPRTAERDRELATQRKSTMHTGLARGKGRARRGRGRGGPATAGRRVPGTGTRGTARGRATRTEGQKRGHTGTRRGARGGTGTSGQDERDRRGADRRERVRREERLIQVPYGAVDVAEAPEDRALGLSSDRHQTSRERGGIGKAPKANDLGAGIGQLDVEEVLQRAESGARVEGRGTHELAEASLPMRGDIVHVNAPHRSRRRDRLGLLGPRQRHEPARGRGREGSDGRRARRGTRALGCAGEAT